MTIAAFMLGLMLGGGFGFLLAAIFAARGNN